MKTIIELEKEFEEFLEKPYISSTYGYKKIYEGTVRVRRKSQGWRFVFTGKEKVYVSGQICKITNRRLIKLGIEKVYIIGRYFTLNGRYRNNNMRVYVMEGKEKGKVRSIQI